MEDKWFLKPEILFSGIGVAVLVFFKDFILKAFKSCSTLINRRKERIEILEESLRTFKIEYETMQNSKDEQIEILKNTLNDNVNTYEESLEGYSNAERYAVIHESIMERYCRTMSSCISMQKKAGSEDRILQYALNTLVQIVAIANETTEKHILLRVFRVSLNVCKLLEVSDESSINQDLDATVRYIKTNFSNENIKIEADNNICNNNISYQSIVCIPFNYNEDINYVFCLTSVNQNIYLNMESINNCQQMIHSLIELASPIILKNNGGNINEN